MLPAIGENRTLALAGLAVSVLIYGGQFVMVRWGITRDGLNDYDFASMRFAVAGTLMLPVFLRYGWRDCCGVGWGRGVFLAMTGGAGMFVISNLGLTFAPALHGACMQPGSVPLFAAIFAAIASRSLPSRIVLVGLPIVCAGLALLALGGAATVDGPSTLIGDALFLVGGAMWASFTVFSFRWRVGPMQATAIVAVLSLVFLPVQALVLPSNLAGIPAGTIAFHAAYQGLLVLILGVLIWSYGVKVVGTETASRFSSLVPVAGFLMAVPILGEWPAPLQWLGMAIAVCGLLGMALMQGRVARR